MNRKQSVDSNQRVGMLMGILRDLGLAWRLFWDRRISFWPKTIPFLALLYVLWPIDILQDPILGLGQIDDLAVILLGVRLFVHLATPGSDEGRSQAESPGQTGGEDTIEGSYRILKEQ